MVNEPKTKDSATQPAPGVGGLRLARLPRRLARFTLCSRMLTQDVRAVHGEPGGIDRLPSVG
jgi:hypothetical protein